MDEISEKKQSDKEILDAWKAEKKAKRGLDRARFKARPLWQRVLIIAGAVIASFIIIFAVVYLVAGQKIATSSVMKYYYSNIYAIEKMDVDQIRKDVVIDEAAASAVDSMPGYGKDDTWGIYIYMVGSNLESCNENDLSDMMKMVSSQASSQNSAQSSAVKKENIQQYLNALDDAEMEMPSPMYVAVKPEASSKVVTSDVVVAERDGAAWMDIEEILKADISDNIDIVIQTGGATRWSKSLINPNRVQRFHIKNNMLVEEDNLPAFSMGTGEAVADFLSYCEEYHDADHKIVIFWNHGGASMGFGHDEIFNQMSSLSDMKEAFAKVYGDNPENPPFELIGFDACLMSSAEVFDTFNGYGKYLAASEETEPGYGWYYTKWLSALSEDLSMNGAQVGKLIADDYMDFYKAQDIAMPVLVHNNVCFTISDISAGKKVYDSYSDLIETVLKDTCSDPEALTALSRAAHESIHYCGEAYDVYNTVDLGIIADNIKERYPSEADAIKNSLEKAVIYNRTVNNMDGSYGVNIYFPDTVISPSSLSIALNYINSISSDKNLSILYFYKCAGCLTDDMKQYLSENSYDVLENINTKSLKQVQYSDVIITDEGNFSLGLTSEANKYIQNYKYDIALLDSENNQIIDYGQNNLVVIDENGDLSTRFTGQWVCLEGQPLSTEIIQSHNGIVTYRSPILLNSKEAYLIYTYSESDSKFTITGAYLKKDEIEGDFVSRNTSDLKTGNTITPEYEYSDADGNTSYTYGKAVRYTEKTEISYDTLKNGTYCSAITFTDVRGDEFNSSVVSFDIKDGEMFNTMESASVYRLEG